MSALVALNPSRTTSIAAKFMKTASKTCLSIGIYMASALQHMLVY